MRLKALLTLDCTLHSCISFESQVTLFMTHGSRMAWWVRPEIVLKLTLSCCVSIAALECLGRCFRTMPNQTGSCQLQVPTMIT